MEGSVAIGSGSSPQYGRLARGVPANQHKRPVYTRPQLPPERPINLAIPVERTARLDYFSSSNPASPLSWEEDFTSIFNDGNESDVFQTSAVQRSSPFFEPENSNSFFAPLVSQTGLWPPLEIPSDVNVVPQYEGFQSPSSGHNPGSDYGNLGTFFSPGPSTGSPQEFSEFNQPSSPLNDGNQMLLDLELDNSRDLPPQFQSDVYNPLLSDSFFQDPMQLNILGGGEIQNVPYVLVDANQGNAFLEHNPVEDEYSRLGPVMDSGEPWNALTAFDSRTARAQPVERPVISDFHGVSTSQMFGPQPPSDQHSTESWTHVFTEPRRRDHSSSPDSWRFEDMSGVMRYRHSPEPQRPKRGRKIGKLSPEKKKATKEVRQKGACWPCFLRKVKCSMENRCAFCEKASNPGNLVLLPCFRDPVESMSPILIPDYVFGHFNEQTLTGFMDKEIGGWGRENIPMKLFWGTSSLIEVELSVFQPAAPDSKLFYRYQSYNNGTSEVVQTRNPLLGIPLASSRSLASLKKQYSNYVHDFVQSEDHLACYSRSAYDDEDEPSKLPGRLLEILCSWYIESRRHGYDLPILRDVLETHVVSTLIDRSFILDQDSYENARRHLKYEFPRDASPSLVQRELKYILFTGQAERIHSVLQEWGKSIRNNKDSRNFWVDFCVLATLCLIMDKTITSAYEFHLYRIHPEVNLETNDEELRKLARIIEEELFQKSKEIFHGKHKTKKGGNLLKDEIRPESFQNHGRGWNAREWTLKMKDKLRTLLSRIGKLPAGRNVCENTYDDPGRLTRIFLEDFL